MVSRFSNRKTSKKQSTQPILSEEVLDKDIFRDYLKFENLLFDDEFIKEIKSSDEKLFSLLDSYSKTIKDFHFSLQSKKRLMHLLKSSIFIVASLLKSEEEASKILIKTTNEILECQRSSLFLFDPSHNQLVQFMGSGLDKKQIRVPKNTGIVSACFNSGERIVVNNAYSDKRFCFEFDKSTGYKTETVLCTPVKNNSEVVVGVLQSLNKKTGIFTLDDEEIHEILSSYGSCILNKFQSNSFNQSELTVSNLKKIIDFILKLEDVHNKHKFTNSLEYLLTEMFHSHNANFFFYEKEIDSAVRYKTNEIVKKKLIGIINHVVKTGKMYLCKSIQKCPYYNSLLDIHTEGAIITFPIVSKDSKNILAVLQFGYNNVNLISQNISDIELYMIDVIENVTKDWIEKIMNHISNFNIIFP